MFHLIRPFPDFAQAHGRVEPIEDSQRHGHVSDNRPSPQAVEMQLNWMRIGSGLLQRVYGPHGEIVNQQEGDGLAPR